jgi:hypothetical protein
MEPSDPMPLHGVAGTDHVSSTVGVSPTELHRPKGPHHRAIRGRRREEKKKLTSTASQYSPAPLGAPVIRRTTRITIGPRGRPQGPLAPQTEPSPPSSPISLTLATPPPPPLALPSLKVSLSSSGMLLDLLSPCSNWVLRRFTRFATPSGKGRAPGS